MGLVFKTFHRIRIMTPEQQLMMAVTFGLFSWWYYLSILPAVVIGYTTLSAYRGEDYWGAFWYSLLLGIFAPVIWMFLCLGAGVIFAGIGLIFFITIAGWNSGGALGVFIAWIFFLGCLGYLFGPSAANAIVAIFFIRKR